MPDYAGMARDNRRKNRPQSRISRTDAGFFHGRGRARTREKPRLCEKRAQTVATVEPLTGGARSPLPMVAGIRRGRSNRRQAARRSDVCHGRTADGRGRFRRRGAFDVSTVAGIADRPDTGRGANPCPLPMVATGGRLARVPAFADRRGESGADGRTADRRRGVPTFDGGGRSPELPNR